jgi:hypothetical protein
VVPVWLLLAGLIASCAGASSPPAPTSSTAPATRSSEAAPDVPTGDVEGFVVVTIELAGETKVVALADTPELRRRGLMGVEDLGDLAGMVFDLGREQTAAFVMRDTLIPLDIAFFGEDGVLDGVMSMTPCEADPCPLYSPDVPFRYALEAPAGALTGLDAGSRISFMG